MRDVRVFGSTVAIALGLVVGACAKTPPPTAAGGSGGPRGTGGAIADASIDRNLTAGVDAVEYASLDGPSGCGLAGAPTGALNNQTITVAGQARTYFLSVPPTYDPSTRLALVFGWHGHGGMGHGYRQVYGIEPAAAGGAIFVYPDGLGTAGNTDWDYTPTGLDVQLFDALLGYLTSAYCIDRSRIFSTGLSAGAFFTNLLGCVRGQVLRAIAPVAGGPPSSLDPPPGTCTGNVGAWIAHASNDPTVDFTTFGIATRDFWIARNGCSTKVAPADASPAECVEYQGCQPDLPVVFCVHTEGHSWPSMSNCLDGGVCFDAGPAVWAFFARFR
jgi:poly(3-hydroxybutyrate) depolymerase